MKKHFLLLTAIGLALLASCTAKTQERALRTVQTSTRGLKTIENNIVTIGDIILDYQKVNNVEEHIFVSHRTDAPFFGKVYYTLITVDHLEDFRDEVDNYSNSQFYVPGDLPFQLTPANRLFRPLLLEQLSIPLDFHFK